MAKKFRGAEIVREIDEAMDKGLARFLIGTQSKLSAASPVDTGRLRRQHYPSYDLYVGRSEGCRFCGAGSGAPGRLRRGRFGEHVVRLASVPRGPGCGDHDRW